MGSSLRRPFLFPGVAFGFALLLQVALASGQTGVGLLVKPGPKDQALEIDGSLLLFGQGHVKEADFDFDLWALESEGRYRFAPESPLSTALGYDLKYYVLGGEAPNLPNRLMDLSLGVGSPLAKSGDWWFAASLGVGYAGDKPFGNGDACYFKLDILFGRDLGSGLLVGVIDYDGNRTIFPDLPLPGIAYSAKFNSQISYVIGLPLSSLTWNPTEQFHFEVRYRIPMTFEATARYEFSKQLQVFAALENRSAAFHLDHLSRNRRLFFDQKRIELGFRWAPTKLLGFSLAGGYAFGQEFNIGFDARRLHEVADISDQPYVRLAAEFRP